MTTWKKGINPARYLRIVTTLLTVSETLKGKKRGIEEVG